MYAFKEPVWVPLKLDDLELSVTADYLRDPEGIIWSPYPDEASLALEQYDAILPTTTIVDAIEANARRIPFRAFVKDKQSYATIVASSHACDAAIAGYEGLVACHKKDIVVGQGRRSHPTRVLIYGARWFSGGRVQPLFPPSRTAAHIGHSKKYKDYSHAARGVRKQAIYRGRPRSLYDCFQDPLCIRRLNNSGVLLEPADLSYIVPGRK